MSKTEKEMIADIYKVEQDTGVLACSYCGVELSAYEIPPHSCSNTYRNTEHRGDGLATHYYELPKGATELRHLIKYKGMEHGVGEAFCAIYRLNDNGEYLRNLKKAKFYIDAAIEYEENE